MRPSMPFEDTLLSLSFFPYLLATSTTFSSTITEHLFLFSHALFRSFYKTWTGSKTRMKTKTPLVAKAPGSMASMDIQRISCIISFICPT